MKIKHSNQRTLENIKEEMAKEKAEAHDYIVIIISIGT